jgi:hypothetical protein
MMKGHREVVPRAWRLAVWLLLLLLLLLLLPVCQ